MNSDEKILESFFLAKNNIGAVNVLGQLMQYDKFDIIHNILKSKNIIGPKIWCLYKDVCNQDINEFIKVCIEDRIPKKCERGCTLIEN